MNIAGLLGLLAGIGITTFAILDSTKNPKIFADPHGIIIVIGGTITVGLLTFPLKQLFPALKIALQKLIGKSKVDYMATIKLIVEIANAYRVDPKKAASLVGPTTHPFLQDGIKLLIEYGFSHDELDSVLTNALKGKKRRDTEEIRVLQVVSRFPPAFGLLGATLGMISLLQTLGEPGAQDRIGPSMATALIATFYGLVVANLVLIPLSEKLVEVSSDDMTMRAIIKEGLMMVQEKKHPIFIEEYLKAFLAPKMRQSIGSGGSSDKGMKNVA